MSRSRRQWCLNWHKSLSYGILLHLVLRQTISCLGGFHTEIRFLGCIGHLTASSGLQEMLELIYAPIGSGSCDKCSTNFSGHQFFLPTFTRCSSVGLALFSESLNLLLGRMAGGHWKYFSLSRKYVSLMGWQKSRTAFCTIRSLWRHNPPELLHSWLQLWTWWTSYADPFRVV